MSQQEMENLEEQADVETPDSPSQENGPEAEAPAPEEKSPEEALQEQLREQEDKYLRLLAEYDNYRKRSQKEKDAAWTNAKADTVKEILPVYDNLDRALKQECADEAYAKGVQMTMTQLKTVLEKLGLEEIPAQGEPFDPAVHNAVMHCEDEALGENTVAEVFQAGFKLGDKIIRHAMVKVAN
ncbi:MAG: nucleotide exchange factor GrpE [Ruminiclostridium sp.]|jgi:molecular chaperone GrpE|nr:nucleotide exchange factor GrpE [Ruminiclostridium sp.]